MKNKFIPSFPEKLSAYARRLASVSPRFARQAYATAAEAKPSVYGADPFGERTHASRCYGLKQRFPDRVLIMTSDACFMNCRHCTRRGLLGEAEVVRTPEQLAACVEYVRQHPRVRDVLLSGGDILTRTDAEVADFVAAFAALPQVEVVRVCTRALCTNPSRVTPRLAKLLARTKKVWVNTQFNCADELTPEARQAAARLVEAGIPVSCQTVLLRGVNDSVRELTRLFTALTAAHIRPYYVFHCDPVAGIDHFRVPLEKAKKLEQGCAARVGGLSLPRFVMDIPGARRKIPIGEVENEDICMRTPQS